jgi:hypothetical protein
MGKVVDYAGDIGRPEYISMFKAHMIRQACTFLLPATNATEPQKLWAKRANFTFADDRSQWYASKALEGLVATSAPFRALLDAKRVNPATPDPTDAEFAALLSPWIAIFVDGNI